MRAAEEAAARREREACALLFDGVLDGLRAIGTLVDVSDIEAAAKGWQQAIRARGRAPTHKEGTP